MTKYLSLAVFLALVFAAGMSGGVFRPGAWYATLEKPDWTPPGWLFAPAWTVLYVLIAIAGWKVWRAQGFGLLLSVWVIQLVFNAIWSYLMFGLHRIDLAMLDLSAMWLAIVAFIILAWPENRSAALLFLPYLAWVTFAGALNFTIWRMNPGG